MNIKNKKQELARICANDWVTDFFENIPYLRNNLDFFIHKEIITTIIEHQFLKSIEDRFKNNGIPIEDFFKQKRNCELLILNKEQTANAILKYLAAQDTISNLENLKKTINIAINATNNYLVIGNDLIIKKHTKNNKEEELEIIHNAGSVPLKIMLGLNSFSESPEILKDSGHVIYCTNYYANSIYVPVNTGTITFQEKNESGDIVYRTIKCHKDSNYIKIKKPVGSPDFEIDPITQLPIIPYGANLEITPLNFQPHQLLIKTGRGFQRVNSGRLFLATSPILIFYSGKSHVLYPGDPIIKDNEGFLHPAAKVKMLSLSELIGVPNRNSQAPMISRPHIPAL